MNSLIRLLILLSRASLLVIGLVLCGIAAGMYFVEAKPGIAIAFLIPGLLVLAVRSRLKKHHPDEKVKRESRRNPPRKLVTSSDDPESLRQIDWKNIIDKQEYLVLVFRSRGKFTVDIVNIFDVIDANEDDPDEYAEDLVISVMMPKVISLEGDRMVDFDREKEIRVADIFHFNFTDKRFPYSIDTVKYREDILVSGQKFLKKHRLN